MIHIYESNEPKQEQNMLFTNKILILRRIVYFRCKKCKHFRLRSLIMISYRLPQVSGQNIMNKALSSRMLQTQGHYTEKYVIDQHDIEISKNRMSKM